jgi:hypothetical protein
LEKQKMSKQTSLALDQRIASALANANTTSAEVMELIAETEAALTMADKRAEEERERALDAIASPDASEAERSAWAAELNRDRLQSSLSRLQQRYDEVARAEDAARWEGHYQAAEVNRNALVKEFREVYPEVESQLCDLFERMKAADQESSRVNSEAPPGEHRRLRGVELTARGLENFSISRPSIMETVRLPKLTQSDHMAWPPPKTPLGVLVAAAMTPPHDARYTADWAAAREQDRARRAATETRWAEEEAARQEERRKVYERSLRR